MTVPDTGADAGEDDLPQDAEPEAGEGEADAWMDGVPLPCEPCSSHEDCRDGIFCNGVGYCRDIDQYTGEGCCELEPACPASTDPCVELTCVEEVRQCVENRVDGDDDGYAAVEVEGEACGGSDCDDGDPSVHPGAEEVCGDGLDNDCDFTADEDAWSAPSGAIAVSHPGFDVLDGDVAAGAEVWIPAWTARHEDEAHLFLGAFHEGDEGVEPYEVSGSRGAEEVEIVALSGGEAFVFWTAEGSLIRAARVSAGEGISAGAAVTLFDDTGVSDVDDLEVAADPGGSHACIFLRSRRQGNNEIYALEAGLDELSETNVSAPVRVSRALGFSGYPSAAARGRSCIVVWEDERDGNKELYVRDLDFGSGEHGMEKRLTVAPGDSKLASVSASPEGFLVTWMDESSGPFGVLALRLDAEGAPEALPIALVGDPGSAFYPCATPDPRGEQYANQHMLMYTRESDEGRTLMLTAVGERSDEIQAGIEVHASSRAILHPSLSVGSVSRTAVWIEQDYTGGELFLVHLECG